MLCQVRQRRVREIVVFDGLEVLLDFRLLFYFVCPNSILVYYGRLIIFAHTFCLLLILIGSIQLFHFRLHERLHVFLLHLARVKCDFLKSITCRVI